MAARKNVSTPVMYKVVNKFGQPRWAPVLVGGPTRPDSPEYEVRKEWYEDEEIPEDKFTPRQLRYWTKLGVICRISQD